MLEPRFFEELSSRLAAVIAATPPAQMESRALNLLFQELLKSEMVAREELEEQRKLLEQARARIAELEAQLRRPPRPCSAAMYRRY